MDMKINIADKTGKTLKKEFKDDQASVLYNKKIGDKINGELIDMPGYEFEIAGGSDYCGFPMRKDVNGIMRKAILTTTSLGNKYKRKGMRLRRTVAGNTIYNRTSQVNLKVIKHGAEALIKEEKK
ncbi:TPA: 30S ribosomal protein S6e [Candidatus Woesearchaeota archaeon]|nr:30S ribosomal protein S6e [Candidatus Woesearchaeota archaeon]HIH31334.1 30S ribosomal protein S6e [Candidatus Woesearchaeota archaeon]HIH55186.1 30S ribosomal protein S6e [Candidatus Woesearchaeota archaeon]HIJ02035.1 30S ribosomal protein S6e [Candidatus Woesearchaeota archaeon]HIJ13636.1 30S ribosomal protein S6e [Candidatus Woesearchaeota archaeon]